MDEKKNCSFGCQDDIVLILNYILLLIMQINIIWYNILLFIIILMW